MDIVKYNRYSKICKVIDDSCWNKKNYKNIKYSAIFQKSSFFRSLLLSMKNYIRWESAKYEKNNLTLNSPSINSGVIYLFSVFININT